MKSVARKSDCSNVFLAADLNCHFGRGTRFTKLVRDCLVEEMGLTIMWQNPDSNPLHIVQNVDYTHLHIVRNVPAFSTIDHFVLSPQVYHAVSEAGVIHSGSNPSNHSAIFAKVKVEELDLNLETVSSQARSSWSKANEDAKLNFKETLTGKLNKIGVQSQLLECHDLHCKVHMECLEEYTMQVLEAMETAGKECLPTVGGFKVDKKHPIPGWSEYVRPYQEESKFWFSVWLSQGKPEHGDLFNNMRYSKSQYKYAVRRLKRAQNKIQNDKFVSGILGGGVNIFQEIRKYRGSSSKISSQIDNEVGAANIANHFATIYSELYNKVELGEKLQNISDNLDKDIDQQSQLQVDKINEELVREALRKMKPNKCDALFDTVSDFYINGPPELVFHLTTLLKLFLSHGSLPYFILLCTLMPLVKDNLGDITSSDNYRAIAGGCLLLKLVDIVILLLEGEKLGCDPLQFGYQARSSTTMCTWTVTSIIDHYKRNGRPVYGCAMDMSKAFDMVEWGELFVSLKERGVHPIYLRVLMFIYKNQQCDVKWAGKYSYRFSVSNGVRQGAVSSAILFSIYINELFVILRRAGLGCHIGGLFLGCFGYADDLFLLSASRSGLQAMVNSCQDFASSRNLKFSTNVNPDKSKTKCLIFSKKVHDRENVLPVLLNGDPLPWVSQVKHLGSTLQLDNTMRVDLSQKRGKFIGKLVSLSQEFHYTDPEVFVKIMNIFTTSFYGSSLWDIFSADCDKLYKSWNVGIRQAFDVDRCTHRYLIDTISNSMHPKIMLASRYVTFFKSLLSSPKPCVRLMARLSETDNRTVLGRTLNTLCNLCGLSDLRLLTSNCVKSRMSYFPVPEEDKWRTSTVTELLQLRNRSLSLPGFTNEEIKDMLLFTCTS